MRLKELREERKMTQLELANAISTSQSNIARWESGLIEPSVSFAVKLATYFNVSTDYLLEVEDCYSVIKKPSTLKLSDKEKALLAAFRRMLPETQDFLLRTAQSLQEPAESPAPKGTVKN